METPAPDPVQQATQLLTHYLHCRKESEGLQACHAQHGVGSEECTQHHAAFTTCANASMMQIVQGLVKIADKFCAEEVAAFQRCKQQGFGDEACESLDLAALQVGTPEQPSREMHFTLWRATLPTRVFAAASALLLQHLGNTYAAPLQYLCSLWQCASRWVLDSSGASSRAEYSAQRPPQ